MDSQPCVNHARNRLNLRSKLLFDPVEVEPVFIREEVDCDTQVTEPARPSNAMEVRLSRLREIKVDHDVDGLNIDSSSKEVRADEVPADTRPEVVEDSVAVRLKHLGVRVETRVAELGDLLGEELDAVC
jgi:hypothetical protein